VLLSDLRPQEDKLSKVKKTITIEENGWLGNLPYGKISEYVIDLARKEFRKIHDSYKFLREGLSKERIIELIRKIGFPMPIVLKDNEISDLNKEVLKHLTVLWTAHKSTGHSIRDMVELIEEFDIKK
jgi:hypothetical protein